MVCVPRRLTVLSEMHPSLSSRKDRLPKTAEAECSRELGTGFIFR